MGVYALVLVGGTTAITGASEACSTWPACNGQWLVGLSDPDLLVAWGHRVAALLVGLAVVATFAAAWFGPASRRVRLALAGALVLYPVQVGLGAVAATTTTPTALLSGVHLTVGVSIFGAAMFALAWTLESTTATEDDYDPSVDAEPVDEADGGPDAPARDLPADGLARVKLVANAYFRLMKPRLMWLLCLVAGAAMALAAATSGADLTVRVVGLTMLGGVLSIGASGTFNHVLERDVDRKMQRTSDRPLAVDVVPVRNALAFGFALATASLVSFAALNLLAAALGLVAILFYSVVYTLVLKPNTVQNIVVGGAAGALPALIGAAAVTGTIGLPGIALAAVIFLWTPAHFYNLALAYKEDYARGGFPMLPLVRGDAVTRKHIVWYFTATLAGAGGLAAVSDLGLLYAFVSITVGAAFLWTIVRLHRERTTDAAFRAFHASNAYLGALLVAVVVDSMVL
ncbi:heme o synthase [Haloarchaeobius salinus]|uniref:heme o synthase n=1 Tax=Haloarchaeobius salinus TaxID=1198298 RepID=UPI00210E34F8|nr:heme o synthase [Haloarchaeobius salinus]